MDQPRVCLAALLREITQWPVPKKTAAPRSHFMDHKFDMIASQLPWPSWNVTNTWEKKILTVLTFSNNKVMIWSYDKAEYHQEKTYLRKVIPPVKTKKSCFNLFQMHFRQVELSNPKVLTTCKLYAFQHKRLLQIITESYWDKKKNPKNCPSAPTQQQLDEGKVKRTCYHWPHFDPIFWQQHVWKARVLTTAVFMHYPSGRTWANIRCSSGYSFLV